MVADPEHSFGLYQTTVDGVAHTFNCAAAVRVLHRHMHQQASQIWYDSAYLCFVALARGFSWTTGISRRFIRPRAVSTEPRNFSIMLEVFCYPYEYIGKRFFCSALIADILPAYACEMHSFETALTTNDSFYHTPPRQTDVLFVITFGGISSLKMLFARETSKCFCSP